MEADVAGKNIGKYRVISTLGRGSMGVVYKARDPEIGRFVAIKTLRKISSDDVTHEERALERFKTEARSAGNLRHSNIITIFEVGRDIDTPFIVMDYVEGESLDAILSRHGYLEAATAIHYLAQIASGLDYAHSKGVIHRDIKPSNLLVDKAGNVFILDFGVASISRSYGIKESEDPENLIMGTPVYMSPEQIINKDLDYRSDLFALAIVAFECFTGKRPFAGENFTAVMGNILNASPISLTALMPDLPLSLEAEFERGLSKVKEDRFSSAQEMVFAFRQALGFEGMTYRAPVAASQMSVRLRKPSSWRSVSNSMQGVEWQADNEQTDEKNKEQSRPEVWEFMSAGQSTASAEPRKPKRPGEVFRDSPGASLAGNVLESRFSTRRIVTAVMGLFCMVIALALVWNLQPKPRLGPDSVAISPDVSAIVAPLEFKSGLSLDYVSQDRHPSELNDKELLAVLVSPDSEEVRIIEALKEAHRRNVPELIEAMLIPLRSDSHIVRVEALKVIGEIGDRRIVPELLIILDDHDPLVRGHAARTLGLLGDRRALDYLSDRLIREDNSEVKIVLDRAIERIRGY
jgi:serine/threonine protein kinase